MSSTRPTRKSVSDTGNPESVRLDRWLWAARIYKTRARAAKAIDGGKVHLNGARAKRAKPIRLGDELMITKGIYGYHLIIRALTDRRGPAAEAQKLYEETPQSRQARQVLAAELKAAPTPVFRGKGRPTKKERRQIDRLRDDWNYL